jgi:hypothetical protein
MLRLEGGGAHIGLPNSVTCRSVPSGRVFPFGWAESTSCRAPGMPACVQAIAETVGKDSALKNTKAVRCRGRLPSW